MSTTKCGLFQCFVWGMVDNSSLQGRVRFYGDGTVRTIRVNLAHFFNVKVNHIFAQMNLRDQS